MPVPLYIVPFGNRLDPNRLSQALRDELLLLRADHALAAFDDRAKTCSIYVDFKDIRFVYANIINVIVGFKKAVYVAEDFGTPALEARRRQLLDDARDAFRATNYAAIDPATTTAITPNMDQAAGLTALMANPGAGFCLGTAHDDQQSKAMLCDGLDNGTLANSLLFIEEVPTALQTVLTDWLEDGNNASPMPPALMKHIQPLDEQMNRTAGQQVTRNFSALLQKAKEQNAKVFGIDGGDADAGVDGFHAGFPERRDARMNKLAADVITEARNNNPGAKFVASVGAAHMNSHEGGIPGIAQLFGIPGITVDEASGKLVPRPDDPTKRPMPSREEQAFIDRYCDSLETEIKDVRGRLGEAGGLLGREIYGSARTFAATLHANGELPDLGSVDVALAKPAVRQRWKAYADVIKAAPETIAEGEVDQMVASATSAGSPALCSMALRHVAGRSRGDLVNRLVPPGDVNARDEHGNPPIMAAVHRRWGDHGDPRADLQAGMVKRLLDKGADPDVQGMDGRTAMHQAALNNNTKALDALQNAGGRTDIADSRQWTAYDVAVGSTKVQAEQWFYDHGQANSPGVTGASPTLSSVDALMKAVKCEDPTDVPRVQAALTELYGNPDLRPVLDLVALDSLSPRDPARGGGLRMVVASAGDVSGLYNDPEKRMNAGYDDVAHVTLFSSRSSGDFAGQMIHEITHAAARIACANTTQPFTTGQKNAYQAAAVGDVRATTLLFPDDPMENTVEDRISHRMHSYVLRYAAEAETKLMQEFIVGVPQLMAEYGSAEVAKLAPGLTQYFRGPFATACNNKAQDRRFQTARGKIDNTALIATAVPRAAAQPTRVAAQPDTPDRLLSGIRDNYRAVHGATKADVATTPYKPAQFQLSWQDDSAFQPRMQRVEKLLRKLLAEQGLPPELSADGLRDLITKMGDQIQRAASVKDIDEPATALAMNWVRKAKEEYGSRPAKDGTLPDDHALAEAIVIRAEDKVWNAGGLVGADPVAVSVDPDKHKDMIAKLTVSLGGMSADKKADPAALVERVAAQLAGGKTQGFYRKPDTKTGDDAEHVSVSGKDARRTWLAELANV